jgi:putative tryptophan/tyrosine transport system substrate-binding protein
VTGVALLTVELAAKRLELLHESLPTTTVVAMLVNPTTPLTEPETRGARDAAHSLGLQLHVLNASTASEIDMAFGSLVELRAGALIVSVDPFLSVLKSWRWRPATRCPQFTDYASSPPPVA